MAYQTGTSTGPDDLLDKLRVWLVANGWTQNGWADDNTTYHTWTGLVGTGKRLHVQKTAADSTVMYFNLRSVNRGVIFEDHNDDSSIESYGKYQAEVTGLAINGSTGYNGSNAWDYQPGSPVGSSSYSWGACMTELSLTAIPAYYFWQDGDTVVVCVEYQSGKFQWLAFGCLDKSGAGAYTGGQFFSGSLCGYYPSEQLLNTTSYAVYYNRTLFFCHNENWYGTGAVYLNIDSAAGWRSIGYQGSSSSALYNREALAPGVRPNDASPSYLNYNTLCSFFWSRAPNHYNALSPFVPLYVVGKRSNGNWSLLGWPKSLRMLNAFYHDPGAEYTLGSDVWMIFPCHAKSDADGGRMGFAVKKVT